MGNIFIPSLNFCAREDNNVNKILKGFEINELFTEKFNYKKPLNENCFVSVSDLTNQNILNDAILFVEDFFNILIVDINKPSLYNNCFDIFIKEFKNFMIYYSIVEDKNTQIDIWTNFILSLRVLLKTKKLMIDKFLSDFCLSIKFLKKGKDQIRQLHQLFMRNLIEQDIDKILFLTLVLFDLEDAEKFLVDLFSPYIAINAFFKKIFLENNFTISPQTMQKSITIESFYKYIKEDNIKSEDYINLKNAFDILIQKIHIFSLINNNKKYKKKELNISNEEEEEKTISTSSSDKKIINKLFEEYENKPFSELILNLNNTISKESTILFKKVNNEKIINFIFRDFNDISQRMTIQYKIT